MYLNCHSWFSLRYGTLSTEDLVSKAKDLGLSELALTDINNSTGILPFARQCRDNGIKPLVGIEFHQRVNGKAGELLYVGLAKNEHGFAELNRFLSMHNVQDLPFPTRAPVLSSVVFVYLVSRSVEQPNDLRPDEYLGIMPYMLNKLYRSPLLHKAQVVFCHPVTIGGGEDWELHKNLRAVDFNCLHTHVQPHQACASWEQFLTHRAHNRLQEKYPHICKATEELAAKLDFHVDFVSNKNRKLFLATAEDDWAMLCKLTHEGLSHRYPDAQLPEAYKKAARELEVIKELGFIAYFLITWDMLRYTKSKGIYHVGRGSGANSLIAYCLGITDVDPLELDLYFERFLNPKRSSPPDFDIDFSWNDRDVALDYLFNKYGPHHVCLMGTISTFGDRSIIRELGKAYGLPKAEIDLLESNPQAAANRHHIARHIATVLEQLNNGKQVRKGGSFPNLRSIHAGGVLISELPIYYYCALDMPPKGYPTAQIDMYIAEDIHLEKLDVLSQRGLGHIKDAVEIIAANKNVAVNIHAVAQFKTDTTIAAQLRSADTIGCFYIESPAMRQLLTKLRCGDYLTLVAASSIIRPGVAQSGMMNQYIQNFHHPDQVLYLHPVMRDQLEETYGVMVYQEDVLKICHHFAGMDLADADLLRRAMSGKYRSGKAFQQIETTFFEGCAALKRPLPIAQEVWRQVSSFAGYSFSKAHSASFAVESYQSLFLKTYYPQEFYTAVINNFGGFYKTWVYFHAAQKAGAQLQLPCVNHSQLLTSLTGQLLWPGFVHVKGLERHYMQLIPAERAAHGEFHSLEDFVARTQINLDNLVLLIRVGALNFTGLTKAQLLFKAPLLSAGQEKLRAEEALFEDEWAQVQSPIVQKVSQDYALIDACEEIELLGFPVSRSWFQLLKTSFRGAILAKDFHQHVGRTVKLVGLLTTYKPIRTRKGEAMVFGTFLDANGDFLDTTHFPDSWKAYPITGRGFYLIEGKIAEEFDCYSVEVSRLAPIPMLVNPLWAE